MILMKRRVGRIRCILVMWYKKILEQMHIVVRMMNDVVTSENNTTNIL